MMTEAEAKTKWCPMVRQPFFMNGGMDTVALCSANRAVRDEGDMSRCIGPACMAWRWVKMDPCNGYCGAFGKPE